MKRAPATQTPGAGMPPVAEYDVGRDKHNAWPLALVTGGVVLSPTYIYVALCVLSFGRYGHAPLMGQPNGTDYKQPLWQDADAYAFIAATLLTPAVLAAFCFVRRMSPRLLPGLLVVACYGFNLVLYWIDPFGAREWIFE